MNVTPEAARIFGAALEREYETPEQALGRLLQMEHALTSGALILTRTDLDPTAP